MSAMLYSSPARYSRLRQPLVQHAMQALDLVGVALDRVGQLLRRVGREMVVLAEHRPDPAHLEHQPLQAGEPVARVGRDQLPGLLGEVDQDRAGLEQRHRRPPGPSWIDDRRDAVVGGDRQELRLELVAGADVDRNDRIRAAPAPRARCAPCGRSGWARSRRRSWMSPFLVRPVSGAASVGVPASDTAGSRNHRGRR